MEDWLFGQVIPMSPAAELFVGGEALEVTAGSMQPSGADILLALTDKGRVEVYSRTLRGTWSRKVMVEHGLEGP